MKFDGIQKRKGDPLQPRVASVVKRAVKVVPVTWDVQRVRPSAPAPHKQTHAQSAPGKASAPTVRTSKKQRSERVIRELYGDMHSARRISQFTKTSEAVLFPQRRAWVSHMGAAVRTAGKNTLNAFRYRKSYQVSLAVALFILIAAFGGGVWYENSTQRSEAANQQEQAAVAQEPGTVYYYAPVAEGDRGTSVAIKLNDTTLYNTPLSVLEKYLHHTDKYEEQLKPARVEKLRSYLREKGSPFADDAQVLARQKHWKFIVAIAAAASDFGKGCRSYNCSAMSGNDWEFRTYENFQDWITDFNTLLDTAYQDWSFQKMAAVHAPDSAEQWLGRVRATLSELQSRGVE